MGFTLSAIRRLAEGLGLAACGVSDLRDSEYAAHLRRWLAEGRHGSMHYLERHAELRARPSLVMPEAACAIVVADQYATRNAAESRTAPGYGRIARYARGRDYHVVLKKRLHLLCDALAVASPGIRTRAFVDTAPLPERELASRAGLGWIAKNSLLIHPRLGSYLLLGGILCDRPVEIDVEQPVVTDHCGTCTRCIDACPTDAITPYSVDASRCVSYLTIERRLPIEPQFHAGIGSWIYGCDVCQEVCPHNSPRGDEASIGSVFPAYRPTREALDALAVLRWTDEQRADAFRSSAMKRATLAMMRRNAAIVLGNALRGHPDDPAAQAWSEGLRAVRDDPSEEPSLRELCAKALGHAAT